MTFKRGDKVAFITDGHETEILWSGCDGELVQVAGVRSMIRATDLRPADAPTQIPTEGNDLHARPPTRIRKTSRKPE